jgi:hypothetical protein
METNGEGHPVAYRRSARQRIPNVNRREVFTVSEAEVERQRELRFAQRQEPPAQEQEQLGNGMWKSAARNFALTDITKPTLFQKIPF